MNLLLIVELEDLMKAVGSPSQDHGGGDAWHLITRFPPFLQISSLS